MRIVFLLTFLIPTFCSAHAYSDSSTRSLIAKGAYLENLGILIPWDLEYDRVLSYGNAKTVKNGRGVDIIWDSAKVFGITVTLKARFLEKFLSTKVLGSLYQVQAPIELKDTQTLKKYFLSATGHEGYITETKRLRAIVWPIDECFVQINIYKNDPTNATLRFGKTYPNFRNYYFKQN